MADDAALGVPLFDADDIQVHRAVDRGAQVGFGHQQQIGLRAGGRDLGQHGAKGRHFSEDRHPGIAQDAKPRLRIGHDLGLTTGGLNVVITITEESELIFVDPFQEFPRLGQVCGRVAP